MVSTPSPPNPYTTADAQTKSNQQTAAYQQQLNDVNQVTPYGSLTYSQTGKSPSGAPITTANLSLSPQLQGLVNTDISNAQNMGAMGSILGANVRNDIVNGTPGAPNLQTFAPLENVDALQTTNLQNINGLQNSSLQNVGGLQNLDLSSSALDNQINQANMSTMDPLWNARQNQTQQQLYDQGLAPGSEGYTQGMNDFNNARNQAYNSMFVADQGQASADLTAQNQSYNNNILNTNQINNAVSAANNASYNQNLLYANQINNQVNAANVASANDKLNEEVSTNNQNNMLQNANYNQIAQQGFANNLTAYNAPINALSALQQGTQIQQPGIGATNTPQTNVAGTNIAGMIYDNYNQQSQNANAAMGGIFGLGSSIAGGVAQGYAAGQSTAAALAPLLLASDIRLKRDITRLGTRKDGIPIYAWRYLWDDLLRSGPMAQDVQALYPEAVVEDADGYLMINYGVFR